MVEENDNKRNSGPVKTDTRKKEIIFVKVLMKIKELDTILLKGLSRQIIFTWKLYGSIGLD